ncbi:MAG: HAD family hydrolase [Myxococcota bacterium]
MALRALLVDLDGTLAESLGALYSVHLEFLAAHGRTGNRESFERINGPPLREGVVILRREFDLREDPQTLYHDYLERVRLAYLERVGLRGGARALLERACDLGLDLGLVTSAPSSLATAFLAREELLELFRVRIFGDGRTRSKPDPAPYLEALRLLGIGPDRAAAVEDSDAGASAARAAGLRVWRTDLGLDFVLARLEEELSDRSAQA